MHNSCTFIFNINKINILSNIWSLFGSFFWQCLDVCIACMCFVCVSVRVSLREGEGRGESENKRKCQVDASFWIIFFDQLNYVQCKWFSTSPGLTKNTSSAAAFSTLSLWPWLLCESVPTCKATCTQRTVKDRPAEYLTFFFSLSRLVPPQYIMLRLWSSP